MDVYQFRRKAGKYRRSLDTYTFVQTYIHASIIHKGNLELILQEFENMKNKQQGKKLCLA